ncbi:MAG: tyrosine-type recombinase/integrase [Candidatus Buchananbacteria bacterium]
MVKSNVSIIKHIPVFLEYCEVEKGLSQVSTKNYHNFLKLFTNWLKLNDLSDLKPHELSDKHIWDYRLYLSHKKDYKGTCLKKTSQSYYLRSLRALMTYFSDKDITSLPAEKIKLPKLTERDKKIKFLSYSQIEKLLEMPDINRVSGLRDRAIMETLFSTGLRVSESTSLNVKQFNLKDIEKNNENEYELSIAGKGGSVRTIYFSSRCLSWILKYLKTRKDMLPPLFINYRKNDDERDDHRLTSRSIESIVRKYTAMAGLPIDATPHTLRHSYATDLLSHGADLRSVQELLGHKDIGTTQIYTHVTNTQLKNIHRKFHSGSK